MGAIRTCCGYFCSMIALIAVPFFAICIAMEGTHNQFQMWILNMPYKTMSYDGSLTQEMKDSYPEGLFTYGKALTK